MEERLAERMSSRWESFTVRHRAEATFSIRLLVMLLRRVETLDRALLEILLRVMTVGVWYCVFVGLFVVFVALLVIVTPLRTLRWMVSAGFKLLKAH